MSFRLFQFLIVCFLISCSFSQKANGAKRPNILFCIADDASYPHMGAYGCKWVKTPGFDRVAKEGILFTRAYTPNAKCAPSRACILTGRNSWQLKEAGNHVCFFPKEFKTYAEALSENGYFVGKTAKGWGPGVALDKDGKRRKMTGTPFDKRRVKTRLTSKVSGTDYAANFVDFLDARPCEKPFCFWYGSTEPHRAYEYGSGIAKGGKKLSDIDSVPKFFPDNKRVRTDLLDYALEIDYFDSHLVQMLEELEKRGELENTIVIVTADNGMPFPRVKSQEYEMSNHLPLAIMWKQGIKHPGRTVNDYVNFIDFAPTFIELAGLEWCKTEMKPTSGRSLTDIFYSKKCGIVTQDRDHILIGKERHDVGRPDDQGYPIRGIIKGDLLYLRNYEPTRWPGCDPVTGYLNCDGCPTKTEILTSRTSTPDKNYWQLSFGKRPEEEMYNIKTDPECLNNLAKNAAYQKQKTMLKKQMISELKSQSDPRMSGNGAIFDRYIYADKRTRDFYNRYKKGEKLKAGWVNPTDFEPIFED